MPSLYEECSRCGQETSGALFCSSYCRENSIANPQTPHEPQEQSAIRPPPQTTRSSSEWVFPIETQSQLGQNSDSVKLLSPQGRSTPIPHSTQNQLNEYASLFIQSSRNN
ncbi:hypothetical protein BO82DRAFT_43370 [Aspergillus uvarum CBS 121591]|uniref:Uncharacterized protein n=1 Tax=Aspergillus uvarum CBS 121591 TaxID=1448315 RepID=A0A319BPH3_9EURO|nr:hypothetical protein BO82DRAFT_43370 [Aspergillus uvarum CBS 121591]PYH75316.1 hypothetical protein BO82DRAFT_43370 [Aspergillus uvarum CBS 121591]